MHGAEPCDGRRTPALGHPYARTLDTEVCRGGEGARTRRGPSRRAARRLRPPLGPRAGARARRVGARGRSGSRSPIFAAALESSGSVLEAARAPSRRSVQRQKTEKRSRIDCTAPAARNAGARNAVNFAERGRRRGRARHRPPFAPRRLPPRPPEGAAFAQNRHERAWGVSVSSFRTLLLLRFGAAHLPPTYRSPAAKVPSM